LYFCIVLLYKKRYVNYFPISLKLIVLLSRLLVFSSSHRSSPPRTWQEA